MDVNLFPRGFVTTKKRRGYRPIPNIPVEDKSRRFGCAPKLNPKKSTHERSLRQRLLIHRFGRVPEGTVLAEQKALADAEENAAADAKRLE